ncbi:protein-disulfide reductase DsbD domain-containing protein [Bartonella senegalensis]|uniref:protein-disulfide reductase DsbD domain-containing protein n=1 Tax=Bartonella senegalensis TaxID=1468418 RepID=UPI00030BDE7D|nr:protein-disulfide reductase DsbD domain-containing protein [Bartonella senegalensis]
MKKIQIFIKLKNILILFYKEFLVTLNLTFVFLGLLHYSVSAQTKQDAYLVTTPWYESDGGRVRLSLTNPSLSRVRNGVIEIVLKPGWKTYWRNPGNSGMAPFFNFKQQVSYEIFYPTPQLYETENDWSIGYENEVLLPFTLANTSDNLTGSFTLGLCNKICLPFTVNFRFSPSIQKNKQLPSSLLKKAQDALPHTTHDELKISAKKEANTLFIKIQNNKNTIPLSLFLDGGEMQIGPAKKVSDTAEYTLFSAPLYFIPDQENHTIFYTISFKDYAFSGTFIVPL